MNIGQEFGSAILFSVTSSAEAGVINCIYIRHRTTCVIRKAFNQDLDIADRSFCLEESLLQRITST